ncbi:MAG: flagellar hook-length control protein FliK [Lachnospiraceae bacterium]|nr:flagellar hook-length control protein FliK [Lachnospiraceae bacterium]
MGIHMNDYRESGINSPAENSNRSQTASASTSARVSDNVTHSASGSSSKPPAPVPAPVAAKALSDAGLPDTPRNRQIVSSLISQELPIDADTLRSVARSASAYPEEPLDALILLRSAGIEVTPSTLNDANAFLTARDMLLDAMNDINAYVSSSDFLSEVPGNTSQGTPVMSDSFVPADSALANSQSSGGPASAATPDPSASADPGIPGRGVISETFSTGEGVPAQTGALSQGAVSELPSPGEGVPAQPASPGPNAPSAAFSAGGVPVQTGSTGQSAASGTAPTGESVPAQPASPGQNAPSAAFSSGGVPLQTDSSGQSAASGTPSYRADVSGQTAVSAQNAPSETSSGGGVPLQTGSAGQSAASEAYRADVSGQALSPVQNTATAVSSPAASLPSPGSGIPGAPDTLSQNPLSGNISSSGSANPAQPDPLGQNPPGPSLSHGTGVSDQSVTLGSNTTAAADTTDSAALNVRDSLANTPLKDLISALSDKPGIERSDISSEGIRKFLESAVSYLQKAGEVSHRRGDEAMAAKVDKAMNSMRTLIKLNDMYAYAEVPVKNEDETKQTHLRFFANKKSRIRKDEGSSAVLHLNMPSLKQLDVKMVLKGNSLKVDFFSSKEASPLLEADSATLSDKLRSIGVEPSIDFKERLENNPDLDPSNMPGGEIPVTGGNIKGFDTRA